MWCLAKNRCPYPGVGRLHGDHSFADINIMDSVLKFLDSQLLTINRKTAIVPPVTEKLVELPCTAWSCSTWSRLLHVRGPDSSVQFSSVQHAKKENVVPNHSGFPIGVFSVSFRSFQHFVCSVDSKSQKSKWSFRPSGYFLCSLMKLTALALGIQPPSRRPELL